MNRNLKRQTLNNNNLLYQQKFFDKGVTNFNQLETSYIRYPSVNEIQNFNIITHTWKQGDSLEKLASIHYADPNYWWVLALFNQKPTEQHFSIGDNVYIPSPLYSVLSYMGY